MQLPDGRPSFADLPDGDATEVFGAEDGFGTLNLLTAEAVMRAASLISSGTVISLNAQLLDWNQPSACGDHGRGRTVHRYLRGDIHTDDVLDNFNPQNSSQWDHFLHWPNVGRGCYYNGHTSAQHGIAVWADRGIVGRGVLLDIPAWAAGIGRDWDWTVGTYISAQDLEACADAQSVVIDSGTILLVCTGWESGYRSLSRPERAKLASGFQPFPGLAPTRDMAEWIWDRGVAAVASDNPALERWPMPEAPVDMLHTKLLGQLGVPIGELWLLSELSEYCRKVDRYEFLLTSSPLNLDGGGEQSGQRACDPLTCVDADAC